MCGDSISNRSSNSAVADRLITSGVDVANQRYTPVQMIAAVFLAFTTNKKGPSIDPETGKPTYQMVEIFHSGDGCAITTVARINPEIHAKILEVRFHDDANVQGLLDAGINIKELINFDQDGTFYDSDYRGNVRDYNYVDFMQDLQNVHDTAAAFYWDILQNTGASKSWALAAFRTRFVNLTRTLITSWGMSLYVVGQEIFAMKGKRNGLWKALTAPMDA